ncbi:DUF2142 domain-containing protein [Propionibacterium freudenreichii]|uniref:DUF2142 domain-containing protein n=1 Tax=Propionibacterium freudenreichii TaxID=1744 RepID=UPI0021A888C3|nr:DUF2142 domain-containing protein [Propionibacterium freudenreichii]MCT2996250.1 DUF2142 domain-containing protein [Propionibacterium freudenreichii]
MRPTVLLLLLGSIFGLFFIAVIPPGYNPDEPSHFLRAAQLGEGQLTGRQIADDQFSEIAVGAPRQTFGGDVPRAVAELFAATHVFPEATHPMGVEKTSSIDWRKARGLHITNETVSAGITAEAYSPLVYAPTLIPYWLGKLLDLPVLVIFYLARILNLAAGLFLTWAAIKLIPRGKWIMLMVGLLPTTIIQFSSVSSDPVAIGLGFLAVALALRIAFQDSSVRKGQWIQLLGVYAALGVAKPAYITLLGVMLAIPLCNRHARKLNDWAPWAIVLLLAAAAALAWQKIGVALPPSPEATAQVEAQNAFVAGHPLAVLKTLFYTFFTDMGVTRYFLPGIFGNAVWARVFLSTPFIYLLCGALALSPLVRDKDESSWEGTTISRAVLPAGLVSLFVAASALIGVGLYMVYTAARMTVVIGLQGRYFLPLIPLLLVAAIPFRARLDDIQGRLRAVLVGIALASLVSMAWQTWTYLWRPGLGIFW